MWFKVVHDRDMLICIHISFQEECFYMRITPDKTAKGLVINYGEGGWGYKMGKSRVRNCLHPPPQDRVKLFAPPPFKDWKLFAPP